MTSSLFLLRCLNLGISLHDLLYINVGMIFDLLEEDIIDEIMQGTTKDFEYINTMDLQEGLDTFLPIS